MKIYIHCASDNYTAAFDTSTTGMSYYDDFLNPTDLKYMQEHKNRTGEIKMLSPNEYFKECSAKIFRGRHSVSQLKQQREASSTEDGIRSVDYYADMMRSGTSFDMPVLDYASPTQEGLHRMYAAGEAFGWDTKFPVLVVEVFDAEVERRNNLWRDMRDFSIYTLDKICDAAVEQLRDDFYDESMPTDMLETFRECVIDLAAKGGSSWDACNIDIDVEHTITEEHTQYKIYLVSYEGMESHDNSYDYIVWEEDVFGGCIDYPGRVDEPVDNKYHPDGSRNDIDVDEFSDLFFRH